MSVTHQFKLRQPKAEEPTSIEYQFYKDGKRFSYSLRLKVLPDLWSTEQQTVIKTKEKLKEYSKRFPQIKTQLQIIEGRMDKVKRLTNSWFANKELNNEAPDLKDLKKYLSEHILSTSTIPKTKNRKYYIKEIIKDYYKGATNGQILTKSKARYKLGTLKVYNSLKTMFELFEKDQKQNFVIEDINTELSNKWEKFLYTETKEKKKSSKSNLGKYNKHFKVCIKWKVQQIEDENYELERKDKELIFTDRQIKRILNGLEAFKYVTSKSTQVYLSQKELQNLYNLKNLAPHHEITRDVFLVGCYTALRYSDYSRVGPEHIKTFGNKKRIQIQQLKTNQKVTIPIRQELDVILEKYNYKVPKTYEQKVNKYIKEVCRIAEINSPIEVSTNSGGLTITKTLHKWQKVTTHTARRTGATLLYLDGHSAKDIMAITGHKTLSSFEKYLRISQDESIKRMEQSKFFSGLKVAN